MKLPYSDELNTGYLARLFDNTSECYKLFWFKAIVTAVGNGKLILSYEELIDKMIADAWYMVTEYHLNLGPKDTLQSVIELMKSTNPELKSSEKESVIIDYLSNVDDINSIKSNYLPNWDTYFPKLAYLEYQSYQLIWKYDSVHREFDKCAKEHINNTDIYYRLYREDLSFYDFEERLKSVILPVYNAAHECGFDWNWEYTNPLT